jgi:hypothetical protein
MNSRRVRLGLTATSLGALVVFVATSGRAGQTYPGGEYCYRNSDGSGACNGTYEGFRDSSYDGDSVSFMAYWGESSGVVWCSGGWFLAYYENEEYLCSLDQAFAASIPIQEMTDSYGNFAITWNSSGDCTEMDVTAASYFGHSF